MHDIFIHLQGDKTPQELSIWLKDLWATIEIRIEKHLFGIFEMGICK